MRAVYVHEAGLDAEAWLRTRDPVESMVTYTLAGMIHERRAEAQRKQEDELRAARHT